MILPVEQHVAPIQLCRRLKDLGAPQDTLFAWVTSGGESHVCSHGTVAPGPWEVAAYSVAELGAMLPRHRLSMSRGYWESEADATPGIYMESTAAEALAKLLIALAERGIVKW